MFAWSKFNVFFHVVQMRKRPDGIAVCMYVYVSLELIVVILSVKKMIIGNVTRLTRRHVINRLNDIARL